MLGTAYPAAFVILWLSQLGHVNEAYEPLAGRKVRLLLDTGGISTYFGNTFKRVQWLGVTRVVEVKDFYFIYFERDGYEGQRTVVTEYRGPHRGERVVRGREPTG